MSVFSEAIGDEQYADEQDESQQDAPHLSLVLHGHHHISLKKRLRAITSTKVHNTMTVAMEMIFLS